MIITLNSKKLFGALIPAKVSMIQAIIRTVNILGKGPGHNDGLILILLITKSKEIQPPGSGDSFERVAKY